jgi:hypothetical protein
VPPKAQEGAGGPLGEREEPPPVVPQVQGQHPRTALLCARSSVHARMRHAGLALDDACAAVDSVGRRSSR